MKKKWIIALLLFAVVGVIGCKDPVTAIKMHSVTVTLQNEKGSETITASHTKAQAGDTVTLTANLGAERDVILTIDGGITPTKNVIIIHNGTAKFEMPERSVVIKAVFADIQYVKVAYVDLEKYLKITAVDAKINYIELMGPIPVDDLKGDVASAGKLGKVLKKYSAKKVGLKLPSTVAGLTDMNYCFNNCTSLVTCPVIPSGVTDMRSTFEGCTGLMIAPAIPHGVTNMRSTFEFCTGLVTPPIIPHGVTNMRGTFEFCTRMTTAPCIPNSVVNMCETFYSCYGLLRAPCIPSGVTDMRSTFYRCTKMTSAPLVIPNSVTDMRATFNRCRELTSVTSIPSSVTNMMVCFSGCTKLTTVTIHAPWDNLSADVDRYKDMFEGCTSLIDGGVKVPALSLSGYKGKISEMGTTAVKVSSIP